MPDLPVMLKVRGWRCVVVGGGGVAQRRARALVEAGADVIVVAPAMDDAFSGLGVTVVQRGFEAGDLEGARLVVIASDDAATNEAAAAEAKVRGILVNHAGAPDNGDFDVPAHTRHGPLTLAVHTGGISPAAAATIRRTLSDALDADWPRLLELAAPYRSLIQQRYADPAQRQARLRRLTDPAAMAILKAQGDTALRRHFDALSAPA